MKAAPGPTEPSAAQQLHEVPGPHYPARSPAKLQQETGHLSSHERAGPTRQIAHEHRKLDEESLAKLGHERILSNAIAKHVGPIFQALL